MEERPSFEAIKSFDEFSKYYWYREELIEICRKLGIDSSGLKAELNHNIEEYFKGNLIPPKARESKSRKTTRNIPPEDLTPETSLLECGFTFGPKFRDFFSAQTGIKNFKFNVDMVASVKKVRETNDLNFTLGDLLDIFYGKASYVKYDKVSLQWNKFVQDFCADEATSNFPNKLKTAAALWKEVRNSSREKIYKRELLTEFADKINRN
ncbi:MAG: SAP domain-containing protein [Treponema sp.]|nr:SAP domain-containing protein [Treponema sp.]